MIELIALSAILLIAGLLGLRYASDYRLHDAISFISGLVAMLSLAAGLIVGAFTPFYYGAGLKADLINSEYGTSYTREQMFFASDIIDTVREIKRQRVELNGNLMQQEND